MRIEIETAVPDAPDNSDNVQPFRVLTRIVEYPDAQITGFSEEHGMVDLSASAKKPKIGEVVSVIPNHCCVVTNMMDEVYAARKGRIEAVYPVAARGKVR